MAEAKRLRPRPSRAAIEARSRSAEAIAAWWLRFKGYRILAQRFRCGAGEIDLIATRHAHGARIVAMVEVKQRPDTAAALAAVSVPQQRRIARAAEAFLARHPHLAGAAVRFDVVTVTGLRPRHWPDAWRP